MQCMTERGGGSLVYISNWGKELIERYYASCGIDKLLFQLIDDLPSHLSSELGKDAEFWQKELDDPVSKIHRLSLLDGAIEYAVKLAENLSEKTGAGLCEYLGDSIERNWIGNWLAGYIKNMLHEYYGLLRCNVLARRLQLILISAHPRAP